jgi:glycosyltransferase involved in cell wall biosynthesis
MKIAILGTRGIPNYYGGFEQCAEFLASGLVKLGHDVIVYNSHDHPYQETIWNGVNLVHCYDPEDNLGTAGQFVYDLNCILDLRKRKVDIILQLGYTSSSIWGWLLPKSTVVTTNMDGLEWKRTKYSEKVRGFLLWAEKLGVKHSDHLISDSKGIQDYIKEKYGKESCYIPYGADVFNNPKETVLNEYGLAKHQYDLLVARLEPENSIEIILDGVQFADVNRQFLVIGKNETKYGEYLKKKYRLAKNIRFLGGIYDMEKLDSIRYFSNIYFHGHTVGGTNPSLLEAMASNSLVCANDNPFNRYILGDDGLYFKNSNDVARLLENTDKMHGINQLMLQANLAKLKATYSWDIIVKQYLEHFESIKGILTRSK